MFDSEGAGRSIELQIARRSCARLNRVLYAIGNNHAGTYYPAVLHAIPFLGEIVEFGPDAAREATLDALIDLVDSFYPEPGFETVASQAGASDLKLLVLNRVRGLRSIVQAAETSACPQSRIAQLAHDLLALLDES
jgi:hypothetical protein